MDPKLKLHFCPHGGFITIVKGAWYVYTGNKWDKDVIIGVKAGGTVTHFGTEMRAKGQDIERRVGGVGMFPWPAQLGSIRRHHGSRRRHGVSAL
jgi:hypothetical protein